MSSSLSSEQSKLSTPIKIRTNVPFVEHELQQDPNVGPTLVESSDRTIELEVCSEVTRYHVNNEIFEKNGRIQLVHDSLGQPAVFSLDAENRLCLLRHVSGAAEGWSSQTISPEGLTLTAFDVMQRGSDIHVTAIALKKPGNEARYTLHYLKTSLYNDQVAPDGGSAAAHSAKTEDWIEVKDNIDRPMGALHLSTVMWKSPVAQAEGGSQVFHVVVGTNASGDRTGSIYTARIDMSEPNPWTKLTFPAHAAGLLQISPMVLPSGESAMVSVSRGSDESKPSRCVGHIFAPDGGFIRQFEAKAGGLEGVNGIFSHLNPWNTTDLILAGNKGIGVCDSTREYDTVAEHILEGIAFKQVVCAEVEDSTRPSTHTRLAIFAVSKDDKLYYVDGERDYAADEPRMVFQYSGLPIRRNVTQMSVRYNALQCSSELLLATDNDSALRFLRREPSGKSWTEDRITRRGRKTIQMDAFVTNLVLTDGLGKPVPPDYEVKLTSEPLHIVANDKSYASGIKETVLTTNENGSILILIPTNGKIACPPLNLSVGGFKFKIDPAQRVDRLIGKLSSEAALSGAEASNGDKIFAGCSPESLSEAASILGKYSDIKASVKAPSSDRGGRDVDFSAQDNNSPSVQHDYLAQDNFSALNTFEWASWFDRATAWAEKFVGDCIESIKYVAKESVKMAIRIAGPVVKMVFMIGKTLCSFVVKTLDTVLTAVGNFLESTLGIDFLNRLLKFFKAMFDPAAIKATQEILKHAVSGSITLTERFLVVNRSSVTALFDDAEDLLKQYIGDPPELGKGGSNSPNIGWITNNPVVRLLSKINPIAWLVEAISEGGADFKAPSFDSLTNEILKAISPSMLGQISMITKLWDVFSREVGTVISNPTQFIPALVRALKAVAWTLTKAIRDAALTLYDVLLAIIHELHSFLTGAWKLGCLTDIWEELTGQEFSLMNFLTYPVALMMNITSVVGTGKLPFEGQAEALRGFNFDSVQIKPLYESKRKGDINQPVDAKMQWSQEGTNGTPPLTSAQESTKTSPVALFSLSTANLQSNSDHPTSLEEIFRRLCVIVENFSRIGISIDMVKESRRIQDKRNRLVDDYHEGLFTQEDLAAAIAAQNQRPTGYEITKWRVLGIFFHAVAIIGGTILRERPTTPDLVLDCIVGVVGIGEMVTAACSLCGADMDKVLEAAGCVAQLNTIVRSAKETPFRMSNGHYIASSTASIVAFGCNKARHIELAVFFAFVDVGANLRGIFFTMTSITEH